MSDIEFQFFNEELFNQLKEFPELKKINKMKLLNLCKYFFDLGMKHNLT